MKKTIVLLLLLLCTISKLFAQCAIGSLFDNWITSGNARTCIGVKLTYYGPATTGVTWSVDDPSIATVDANGGVTGLSAGTTILSYSDLGGCSTQIHYDVITPTDITVSSNSPVCEGTTLTLTTNLTHVVSPSFEEFKYYYVYPDNSVIEAGHWPTAISTVTHSIPAVTMSSGGIYTVLIRSQYDGYYSCATTGVVIDPLPTVATISGATSICSGTTLSLTDVTSGGSWTSSNTSVATINSSGVVYGVISGTTTISYGVSNTCGTTYVTASVPVASGPSVAAISGATSVCIGADISLTDATPTGTWSSSAPAKATINSSGVVHGVANGFTTISYTVTNSCGSTTVTYPLESGVSAGPISLAAGSVRIICRGTTTTLVSGGTPGGIWSVPVPGNNFASVNTTTGVVTGTITGATYNGNTVTITYTATNACGSATANYAVRVKGEARITAAPFGGVVCVGDVRTLTATPATGGLYTWTASGSLATTTLATNIARITGIATGSDAITYTFSNALDTSTCITPVAIYSPSVNNKTVYTLTGPSALSTGSGTCIATSGVITVTKTPSSGSAASPVWTWAPTSSPYATLTCTSSCTLTNTITAVNSGGTQTVTFSATTSGCSSPYVATYTVPVYVCKPGRSEPEIETAVPINNIRVYPNPTRGVFTLEIPIGFDAAAITIADITGKIIFAKITEKDKLDFDLAGYPRGMYIISVTADDKKYRDKVLIE